LYFLLMGGLFFPEKGYFKGNSSKKKKEADQVGDPKVKEVGAEAAEDGPDEGPYAQNGFMETRPFSFLC